MSTPYEYIEQTGMIVADTSDVLATVQGEFQTTFGADISVAPDTLQGALITGEVIARSAVVQNNAAVANQLNPNEAGGVALDAICALMGLERAEASYTVVENVPVGGQPNTTIPAGSQAQTVAGDYFATTGNVQLDATGNATATFQAVESGPVPCADGALTQVVPMGLGWETVNNTGLSATLGALEQSDGSLRELRRKTLALQGISTVEAQISGLYALQNVNSLAYRENYTSVTAVIDGITLVRNSVWACVDGGTDLDIATSLLENKTDGAAWNGAITVPVVEPSSGQTYNVQFDRPAPVAVIVRVTMRKGSSVANLPVVVPNAVVAYAQGQLNDDPGFVVGGQVSPFDIAGAVAQQVPGAFVSKVEVALASTGAYQTTELPIALNQKASINVSSVNVVIVT